MNEYNESFLSLRYKKVLKCVGDCDGRQFGFECGDGWLGIAGGCLEFMARYAQLQSPDLTVSQVKEKFGVIRIYCYPCDEIISAATDIAELVSSVVCEGCGRTGQLIEIDGWLKTRCSLEDGGCFPEHAVSTKQQAEYIPIYAAAVSAILALFGESAYTWVQKCERSFAQRKPYEMLATIDGCHEVILLLKRLEYGVGI